MSNDFTDEMYSRTDVEYILCEAQLITTSHFRILLSNISEHCLLSLFIKQFLLADRDQVTSADRPTHLEKMMKRVENLEEEVKSLKSELFKVNLTNANNIL